jgi:hypothetical protein
LHCLWKESIQRRWPEDVIVSKRILFSKHMTRTYLAADELEISWALRVTISNTVLRTSLVVGFGRLSSVC